MAVLTHHRLARLMTMSFIVCHLSLAEAQAQVRFGVKGGFQLAEMEFNSKALKESNRAGFFIGPTLKIGLPITGLSVDATLLFDQRDLRVQGDTFKQKSLVAQGNMRAGAGLGDALSLFISAGPQFSFNVGDDVKQWFADDGDLKQFSLQETMLSFNIGAGATIAKHLEASVCYNLPISKTADFTWQQLGDELSDQTWHHAKTRTNAWSLAVVYYF